MSALIELNTDGLAKLADTICHGLGITAYGNKNSRCRGLCRY